MKAIITIEIEDVEELDQFSNEAIDDIEKEINKQTVEIIAAVNTLGYGAAEITVNLVDE